MRVTEKQVLRAIKTLTEARLAIEPLQRVDDANDSVVRLGREIDDYCGYLQNAGWWREKPQKGRT